MFYVLCIFIHMCIHIRLCMGVCSKFMYELELAGNVFLKVCERTMCLTSVRFHRISV